MRRTYKGFYKPKNPEKYVGDISQIVYRSSWERAYFRYIDQHPSIIQWNAEEVVIPYVSPLDNKVHRYFVDVWIRFKAADGSIKMKLVEIKPAKETRMPANRKSKRFPLELETYVKNQAKWEAAKKFAEERGAEFIVLTENELCHISSSIKPEKR